MVWGWLLIAAHDKALRSWGITLFLVTISAWLVNPPAAGYWAGEVDRLSYVFVLFTFLVVGANEILIAIRGRFAHLFYHPWRWAILCAIITLPLLIAWKLLFPRLLQRFDDLVTYEYARIVLDNLPALYSVFISPRIYLILYLIYFPHLLAMLAIMIILARQKTPKAVYGCAVLLAILIFSMVALRFLAYFIVLSMVCVSLGVWYICRDQDPARRIRNRLWSCLLVMLVAAQCQKALESKNLFLDLGHNLQISAPAIDRHFSGKPVLAPLPIAPLLPWHTNALGGTSGFHRSEKSIDQAFRLWWETDLEQKAYHQARELGIAGFLIPRPLRFETVSRKPGTKALSLAEALGQDTPPSWLVKIVGDFGQFRIYKVKEKTP